MPPHTLPTLIATLTLLLLPGCGGSEAPAVDDAPVTVVRAERTSALTLARDGFRTTLRPSEFSAAAPDVPPSGVFELVTYESPVGPLAAYLSPDPGDGLRHPAMIWITGGDCNSIGDVWSDAPEDNDQTASAFRDAGLIMMYPSLRGGNQNPGQREGFFGEVEDVLAAAEYLANLPYVDADRIYLGGHSTGGTLVLLVAASTSRFRAVFSFGPVSDPAYYGSTYCPFDFENPAESRVRAPIHWLDWIGTFTFVFEGSDGNIDSLHEMDEHTSNGWVTFIPVPGADHFNILAPVNRMIVGEILQDTGPQCRINISEQRVQRAFRR